MDRIQVKFHHPFLDVQYLFPSKIFCITFEHFIHDTHFAQPITTIRIYQIVHIDF